VSFVKTAKQIEATALHASAATHIMLCGGARSGKTFINMRNLIIRALKCKSNHAVFRKRFNHLKTSILNGTLPKLLSVCFPELKVHLNRTDYYLELPNGSRILFGGLDDKERTEKILGNEFSTIFLEECSQISYESRAIVLSRLAEKTQLKNKIFYGCNPPSMSHWTYKLFVEKVDPISKIKLASPEDFAYLKMNPVDNADNINSDYITKVLASMSSRERARFEHGEFLSDKIGAIFNYNHIIYANAAKKVVESRICVAVDPSTTSGENSDMVGIVVLGTDGHGVNVIADLSTRTSPGAWGNIVVNAYNMYRANCIVYESNGVGDLLKTYLKTLNSTARVVKVHSKVGKHVRADAVLYLYEEGRVYHPPGLNDLESEMTEYVPLETLRSPNRLDALVHGLTYLMNNANNPGFDVF
jgi:phage terminase large subunit-like protein